MYHLHSYFLWIYQWLSMIMTLRIWSLALSDVAPPFIASITASLHSLHQPTCIYQHIT